MRFGYRIRIPGFQFYHFSLRFASFFCMAFHGVYLFVWALRLGLVLDLSVYSTVVALSTHRLTSNDYRYLPFFGYYWRSHRCLVSVLGSQWRNSYDRHHLVVIVQGGWGSIRDLKQYQIIHIGIYIFIYHLSLRHRTHIVDSAWLTRIYRQFRRAGEPNSPLFDVTTAHQFMKIVYHFIPRLWLIDCRKWMLNKRREDQRRWDEPASLFRPITTRLNWDPCRQRLFQRRTFNDVPIITALDLDNLNQTYT